MTFVFLDSETSGLSVDQDITELGAVYINDKFKPNFKNAFHKRLFLQNPDIADEEALKIGHYSEAIWEKTAVDAEDGLLQLNEWLKKVSPSEKPTMVAQNAEFDKSMLFSNSDRHKIYPYVDNSWVDLIGLWIIYKVKNKIKHLSNSQGVIAKHFGISNPKAHAALSDAATGALCFCKMMKAIEFKE
jgi:DNA polymerase III alpha subunit (gram-positive type)